MNNPFKRFLNKTYKAFMKCPNCNFGSEVKINKGTSVAQFVKGGKCSCDQCGCVFYPKEYTTDYFEEEKLREENKDLQIKAIKKHLETPYKSDGMGGKEVLLLEKKGDIKWLK